MSYTVPTSSTPLSSLRVYNSLGAVATLLCAGLLALAFKPSNASERFCHGGGRTHTASEFLEHKRQVDIPREVRDLLGDRSRLTHAARRHAGEEVVRVVKLQRLPIARGSEHGDAHAAGRQGSQG